MNQCRGGRRRLWRRGRVIQNTKDIRDFEGMNLNWSSHNESTFFQSYPFFYGVSSTKNFATLGSIIVGVHPETTSCRLYSSSTLSGAFRCYFVSCIKRRKKSLMQDPTPGGKSPSRKKENWQKTIHCRPFGFTPCLHDLLLTVWRVRGSAS